jgi:hypothetical protein
MDTVFDDEEDEGDESRSGLAAIDRTENRKTRVRQSHRRDLLRAPTRDEISS